jgi:hypothetical protein
MATSAEIRGVTLDFRKATRAYWEDFLSLVRKILPKGIGIYRIFRRGKGMQPDSEPRQAGDNYAPGWHGTARADIALNGGIAGSGASERPRAQLCTLHRGTQAGWVQLRRDHPAVPDTDSSTRIS